MPNAIDLQPLVAVARWPKVYGCGADFSDLADTLQHVNFSIHGRRQHVFKSKSRIRMAFHLGGRDTGAGGAYKCPSFDVHEPLFP